MTSSKKPTKGTLLFLIIFIVFSAFSTCSNASTTTTSSIAPAVGIQNRVNEVVCSLFNLVLLTAGAISSLMIMFAGLKYMRAGDDPSDADNAKKMVGYALTGLVIALIACPLVDFLVINTKIVPFEESCKCFSGGVGGGSTTTTTNGYGTTTTTIGPGGSTTSTTTTTTLAPLTAENLVACINGKGTYYTDHNCHFCVYQHDLFDAEVGPAVGNGAVAYNETTTGDPTNSPCLYGGIPCWEYPGGGKAEVGCRSFPELNDIYECLLEKIPGHSYQLCKTDP